MAAADSVSSDSNNATLPSAGNADGAVVKLEPSLIEKLDTICDEIFERWDNGQKSGRLLAAMSGRIAYRPDVDDIRRTLSAYPTMLAALKLALPAIRDEPDKTGAADGIRAAIIQALAKADPTS